MYWLGGENFTEQIETQNTKEELIPERAPLDRKNSGQKTRIYNLINAQM
jgi:hypothetical protein